MIYALGMDWTCAALEQREQVMVPEQHVAQYLQEIVALPGVEGCTLLQTCNRFELYLDTHEEQNFSELLPQLSQARLWSDEQAQRHLMEVAAGLCSQVLGEDQIISQVRSAVKAAREAKTTTPTLETLFRLAVTAGKAVRTTIKFSTVAPSTAQKAIEVASSNLCGLEGKRAVVVGNGEIGKLAAQHLLSAGCSVAMTLRSYHRGSVDVPQGCTTLPYRERLGIIEGCDVLVSATKSPHFTLTADMFSQLIQPPRVVIDLAMPRDIEKPAPSLQRSAFFDIDTLCDGEDKQRRHVCEQASVIIDKHHDNFKKWQRGRAQRKTQQIKRVAVFAGTSEGRVLCDHLSACGISTTAFVATQYGRVVLNDSDFLSVRTGRLTTDQMVEVLSSFSTVVDATHPFATQVSRNIYEAARQVNASYVRLVRPSTNEGSDVISVTTMQQAAEFLATTQGPVLATIGTKELAVFTHLQNYAERMYVRILPDPSSLQHCFDLGFLPSHLIGMQGPFSFEMNKALMQSIGARWLLTKDTGDAGGFSQKLQAADELGIKSVVVARPEEPVAGFTLEEVCIKLTGSTFKRAGSKKRRFPLFVDVAGKRCLVVGGGKVGLRRAQSLCDFGAEVVLIAPEAKGALASHAIRHEQRCFTHGDTQGMTLVVAATNNTALNQVIAQECRSNKIAVNVSDDPRLCDFFFPALCTSEHLSAGVVGDGEHHGLVVEAAAAIRATMKGIDS